MLDEYIANNKEKFSQIKKHVISLEIKSWINLYIIISSLLCFGLLFMNYFWFKNRTNDKIGLGYILLFSMFFCLYIAMFYNQIYLKSKWIAILLIITKHEKLTSKNLISSVNGLNAWNYRSYLEFTINKYLKNVNNIDNINDFKFKRDGFNKLNSLDKRSIRKINLIFWFIIFAIYAFLYLLFQYQAIYQSNSFGETFVINLNIIVFIIPFFYYIFFNPYYLMDILLINEINKANTKKIPLRDLLLHANLLTINGSFLCYSIET